MLEKLSDLEKVKIETFCQDTEMFNAVKKVLLATTYNSGVLIEGEEITVRNPAFNLIATAYQSGDAVSNEMLGQRLRGIYEGVDAVENGFAILKKVTTAKESPYQEENEAI